MRRLLISFFAYMMAFPVALGLFLGAAHADNETDIREGVSYDLINGITYDLGEKDHYDISKAKKTSEYAKRFYVRGNISSVSEKNGFVSYAVKTGNLDIIVDTKFESKLLDPKVSSKWHIVQDKSNIVDSTKLAKDILSGAIIVQTSKDGKVWINSYAETDIYNNINTLNERSSGGDTLNAFYRTTNVQITNGCYYRIIVAYKLQREVDPTQIAFVKLKNTEEKERIEIYKFYAFDPSVNQGEELNTKTAYEFGEVNRVDDQDGFKNPKSLEGDDPHVDWSVGKFYISGYTDVIMENGVPVFLKVPKDRAALWFNLEQELDKCNGRTDVQINYIDSASDTYFGTPVIKDFGRGALIVRKTDKNNLKERQIYTNYLEASATVGANTRVDLFEEGDYEVALDYQLHYDKPFVFGMKTAKTLTYRIFFKFKVRNGDISVFLRDIGTDQFITNANVAEHGFYIDVANSQYLNMTIKREVLTESLDGLVEDTKFSAVAKEGRKYTDEGIYTVTVKNLATGDSVVKRIYVGNQDVLIAHMATGLPISEISERIASGATIDENGQIVDPEEEIDISDIEENPTVEMLPSSVPEATATPPSLPTEIVVPQSEQTQSTLNITVVIAIVVVLVGSGTIVFLKNRKK